MPPPRLYLACHSPGIAVGIAAGGRGGDGDGGAPVAVAAAAAIRLSATAAIGGGAAPSPSLSAAPSGPDSEITCVVHVRTIELPAGRPAELISRDCAYTQTRSFFK